MSSNISILYCGCNPVHFLTSYHPFIYYSWTSVIIREMLVSYPVFFVCVQNDLVHWHLLSVTSRSSSFSPYQYEHVYLNMGCVAVHSGYCPYGSSVCPFEG